MYMYVLTYTYMYTTYNIHIPDLIYKIQYFIQDFKIYIHE